MPYPMHALFHIRLTRILITEIGVELARPTLDSGGGSDFFSNVDSATPGMRTLIEKVEVLSRCPIQIDSLREINVV